MSNEFVTLMLRSLTLRDIGCEEILSKLPYFTNVKLVPKRKNKDFHVSVRFAKKLGYIEFNVFINNDVVKQEGEPKEIVYSVFPYLVRAARYMAHVGAMYIAALRKHHIGSNYHERDAINLTERFFCRLKKEDMDFIEKDCKDYANLDKKSLQCDLVKYYCNLRKDD